VYDLAQLIHQLNLAPVSIIAHSMGGNIATRYAGLYPENVRKMVNIEGLGLSPKMQAERDAIGIQNRFRQWIDDKRNAAGRTPKRYPNIEAAYERMKAENSYLTDEQARHLTVHGISRNEDGSWSWKFDNYLNIWAIFDMPREDLIAIWKSITCPMLMMYGADSGASNPEKDGRAAHFASAKVVEYENAGHWLHHDQFDRFMAEVKAFL
jgi:pimeloyl-ACP methyl ester carboxylesterase